MGLKLLLVVKLLGIKGDGFKSIDKIDKGLEEHLSEMFLVVIFNLGWDKAPSLDELSNAFWQNGGKGM